jgi:hypothetical protein
MTSTPSAPSRKPSPDSADAPDRGAAHAPELARVAGANHPRPPTPARFAAVVALALGLIAVLGQIDPFDTLGGWLTGTSKRTQPVDEDPTHIDPDKGERLLATLRAMPDVGERRRILVFGNSQQFSASLPRGVAPDPARRVPIASALLARSLEARAPLEFHLYNLAVPNQNSAEALWQLVYWLKVAPKPPRAVILQASFDTFRKTTIRAGYQTLLEDPRYRSALAAFLSEHASRPYAADFVAARDEHAERVAALTSEGTGYRQWSPEPGLRRLMQNVPLYQDRAERRTSFLSALYSARVWGLGISPTTRRHITGAPFEQNIAALLDLILLARGSGSAVFVYNAPVNPVVDMFYPDEYEAYLARLSTICREHDVPFADLANAVPAERWGYWFDGPDPIHFDEHAHQVVHDRLFEAFSSGLLAL